MPSESLRSMPSGRRICSNAAILSITASCANLLALATASSSAILAACSCSIDRRISSTRSSGTMRPLPPSKKPGGNSSGQNTTVLSSLIDLPLSQSPEELDGRYRRPTSLAGNGPTPSSAPCGSPPPGSKPSTKWPYPLNPQCRLAANRRRRRGPVRTAHPERPSLQPVPGRVPPRNHPRSDPGTDGRSTRELGRILHARMIRPYVKFFLVLVRRPAVLERLFARVALQLPVKDRLFLGRPLAVFLLHRSLDRRGPLELDQLALDLNRPRNDRRAVAAIRALGQKRRNDEMTRGTLMRLRRRTFRFLPLSR